jgi:hypothetical protein
MHQSDRLESVCTHVVWCRADERALSASLLFHRADDPMPFDCSPQRLSQSVRRSKVRLRCRGDECWKLAPTYCRGHQLFAGTPIQGFPIPASRGMANICTWPRTGYVGGGFKGNGKPMHNPRDAQLPLFVTTLN